MSTETWLDHLSHRHTAQRHRTASWGQALSLWSGGALFAVFILATFVGPDPFSRASGGDAAGGSLERQIIFLGLAALSVPLILMRWHRSVAILWRSWPLLLVFAALATTALWSDAPMVTVRRMVPMVIILMLGLALAATLRHPRHYLVALALGFGFVVLFDLALAVVMPGFAYDELGLAGLHPSKNVAGMVGQMAAIAFAAGLVGARHPALFYALVAGLMTTMLFLLLTNSKTALGLTVLSVAVLVPALALAHRAGVLAAAMIVGVIVAGGAMVLASGALNLTALDWAALATGDATFTNRDDIWRAVRQVIEEAPWLGHGFGAVWAMLPLSHPLTPYIGFWTDSPETLRIINQAHNGYLDLMVHGGVFLVAVVALFVLHAIVRIAREVTSRGRWFVAGNVLYATFLASTLASNLLESTLFFPDGLLGQFLILLSLAHVSFALTEGDPSGRGNQRAQSKVKERRRNALNMLR